MAADTEAFLERWHQIVANRDLEGLREMLAEDVTLGAPPYWNKLDDRETVLHLLGLIVRTIQGFTYHREWVRGNELALEFRGSVDGLSLQGIDLITLDEDGRVRDLEVPMRPLNAVTALRERIAPQMMEYLRRRAEASPGDPAR